MGYRAEKRKVEGKAKKLKRFMLGILLLCMATGAVLGTISSSESWKYKIGLPATGKRTEGELRIHFLDVGEGEATFVELPDGKTVLIDGGADGGNSEKTLLRYLNALGVDTVDHLVVTNTQEKYCGGLDALVKEKEVKTAYLPKKTPVSGSAYAEFYTALVKENCERVYSSRNIQIFTEGEEFDYTLSFLYPYTLDVEGESETEGCALWLEYSGVSTLVFHAPKNAEDLLTRDDRLGLFKTRGVDLTSTEFLKYSFGENTPSDSFLEYLGAERIETVGKGHTILTVSEDGTYTLKTLD